MNPKNTSLPFSLPAPLRLAQPSDIPELSRAYSAAFACDPVRQWLLGAKKSHRWQGRWLSAGILSIGMSEGVVITTPDLDALHILTPPKPGKSSAAGMAQVIVAMGFGVKRAIWLKDQIQQQAPKQPHWHVAVLATAPAAQGLGKCQALLEPVLEHAQQSGEPVWLESSNPVNDSFYTRMGFKHVGELALPNGHELGLMRVN